MACLNEMGGGVDNESTTVFSYIYIYSETVGGARERNLRENSKEVSSLTERCFKGVMNWESKSSLTFNSLTNPYLSKGQLAYSKK